MSPNNIRISRIILVGIVFILSIIFLIVFLKLQSAIWLLMSALLFGYFIAELIKELKKENEFEANDLVMFILTFLIPIIITFIPLTEPPIKKRLNRLYFPKDSVDFEKEFIIYSSLNSNPPKLIFAFDNSGSGLTDILTEKSLKEKYEKYCIDVERFFSNGSESEIKLIQKTSTKKTFGNLLKIRLCFDLIKRVNDTAEFIVLKIGDDNIPYSYGDNGYSMISKDKIQDEIVKILKTGNNEIHTSFDKLNYRLREYTKKTDKILSEYALYIYSDFYYDYEGREEKDEEVQIIKDTKRDLLHKVVQNCFIDNHKRDNRGGKFILDSLPAYPYEKHFLIDKINEESKVPVRIVETDNLSWYYSKDDKMKIVTSFRIIFNKGIKSICSLNNTEKDDYFFINDEQFDYQELKTLRYEDTSIPLKYIGENVPKKTVFEIEHNDIHYFVHFKFIEEWDASLQYWLPISAFIIGFLIGIYKRKRIDLQ